MSWMNVARVAKVLAILMFLLPWLVVSCNGSPLIEMSGVDMAIGKAEPAADSPLAGLAKQAEDAGATRGSDTSDNSAAAQAQDSEGLKLARLWVPAGGVLIVLGLVLGFVLRPQRKAAMGALAGAVGALAVLGGGMAWTVSEFRASMAEASAQSNTGEGSGNAEMDAMGRQMAEAVAKAIKLEIKPGYWLTLVALFGSAAAAFMAMSGRGVPGITITVNPPRDD